MSIECSKMYMFKGVVLFQESLCVIFLRTAWTRWQTARCVIFSTSIARHSNSLPRSRRAPSSPPSKASKAPPRAQWGCVGPVSAWSDSVSSSDLLFFSRRFSWKKESTIVMAYRQCFFRYTWSDQNSSTEFSIVPVGQGTESQRFFLFFRLTPLWIFCHCEIFFRTKSFPQSVHPSIFFGVMRQNGCWKIPNGPPVSFFSELWDFQIFFSSKGPQFTNT